MLSAYDSVLAPTSNQGDSSPTSLAYPRLRVTTRMPSVRSGKSLQPGCR